MSEQSSATIVLNHPAADEYSKLISEKFPNVRIIKAPDESSLSASIGDADILVAFRFPVEFFDRARKLRWFQATGAGVDSLTPIRDRIGNLVVTNARGIHGDVIADYVMAGLTMLHWNFRGLMSEQLAKQWAPRPVTPLADMTMGVVGLGSIGGTIARRGKSAGMKVLGTKANASTPVEGVDKVFVAKALKDMLPLCHFVVLAVPGTTETSGLIGSTELQMMREGGYLANIARGNVVIERDLIYALSTGKIAGALLDVFEKEPLPAESPLWGMKNVIITPHLAGYPSDYVKRVFGIFGENLKRFLAGKQLTNTVDLSRGY